MMQPAGDAVTHENGHQTLRSTNRGATAVTMTANDSNNDNLATQRNANRQVVGKYELGKALAIGDFDCRTRLCTHTITGESYVVRIYDKAVLAEASWMWERVRGSIHVQRTLPKHENIVDMKECFETRTSLYILMLFFPSVNLATLLRGSEGGAFQCSSGQPGRSRAYTLAPLMATSEASHRGNGNSGSHSPQRSGNGNYRRSNSGSSSKGKGKGSMSVANARHIFEKVVAGLIHMHQHGVVHLGIAPDHILVNEETGQVKISNLVSCCLCPRGRRLTELHGTRHTVAPEVLAQDPYDPYLADAWSLGVLLYYMLNGGYYPHDGANTIKHILYHHVRPCRKSLPEEAKDLVARLLQAQPAERLTVEAVMFHPFMTMPLPDLRDGSVSEDRLDVPTVAMRLIGAAASGSSVNPRRSSLSESSRWRSKDVNDHTQKLESRRGSVGTAITTVGGASISSTLVDGVRAIGNPRQLRGTARVVGIGEETGENSNADAAAAHRKPLAARYASHHRYNSSNHHHRRRRSSSSISSNSNGSQANEDADALSYGLGPYSESSYTDNDDEEGNSCSFSDVGRGGGRDVKNRDGKVDGNGGSRYSTTGGVSNPTGAQPSTGDRSTSRLGTSDGTEPPVADAKARRGSGFHGPPPPPPQLPSSSPDPTAGGEVAAMLAPGRSSRRRGSTVVFNKAYSEEEKPTLLSSSAAEGSALQSRTQRESHTNGSYLDDEDEHSHDVCDESDVEDEEDEEVKRVPIGRQPSQMRLAIPRGGLDARWGSFANVSFFSANAARSAMAAGSSGDSNVLPGTRASPHSSSGTASRVSIPGLGAASTDLSASRSMSASLLTSSLDAPAAMGVASRTSAAPPSAVTLTGSADPGRGIFAGGIGDKEGIASLAAPPSCVPEMTNSGWQEPPPLLVKSSWDQATGTYQLQLPTSLTLEEQAAMVIQFCYRAHRKRRRFRQETEALLALAAAAGNSILCGVAVGTSGSNGSIHGYSTPVMSAVGALTPSASGGRSAGENSRHRRGSLQQQQQMLPSTLSTSVLRRAQQQQQPLSPSMSAGRAAPHHIVACGRSGGLGSGGGPHHSDGPGANAARGFSRFTSQRNARPTGSNNCSSENNGGLSASTGAADRAASLPRLLSFRHPSGSGGSGTNTRDTSAGLNDSRLGHPFPVSPQQQQIPLKRGKPSWRVGGFSSGVHRGGAASGAAAAGGGLMPDLSPRRSSLASAVVAGATGSGGAAAAAGHALGASMALGTSTSITPAIATLALNGKSVSTAPMYHECPMCHRLPQVGRRIHSKPYGETRYVYERGAFEEDFSEKEAEAAARSGKCTVGPTAAPHTHV